MVEVAFRANIGVHRSFGFTINELPIPTSRAGQYERNLLVTIQSALFALEAKVEGDISRPDIILIYRLIPLQHRICTF